MIVKNIHIEELKEYIDETFYGDEEILNCYDKSVPVTRITDVCENVFAKIESLQQPAELRGVEIGNKKVGYFAFHPGNLISFGMSIEYRNKENLSQFWSFIKGEIGVPFKAALYDYNKRGIIFLKKGGMTTNFENVTLLQCL